MKKKDIANMIAAKLKQIRDINRFSIVGMAKELRVHRETYAKNEIGKSIPGIISLYNLGNLFHISLDWLIMDRGPMYFTEKTKETNPAADTSSHQPVSDDVKELLDHMEKIPLLKYELLSQFYRFKEEHQPLVEKAMGGGGLHPQSV